MYISLDVAASVMGFVIHIIPDQKIRDLLSFISRRKPRETLSRQAASCPAQHGAQAEPGIHPRPN